VRSRKDHPVTGFMDPGHKREDAALMDNSDHGLTVILPMFNEGKDIYKNLRSVLAELQKIPVSWDVIVVDDGSTDNSKSQAEKALDDIPNARIVSYGPNRGRGFALRAGFEKAKGDIVITTESDLSWGPKIIPDLFTAITGTNADVVIASPYVPGGGLVNVPWRRRSLSRFGNKILTFGLPGISMISGMTRAYRRRALNKIALSEDGKEIHLEIISKLIAIGAVIKEIPGVITWQRSGPAVKKARKDFRLANVIMRHIYYSLVESPFHFIGLLGLLFIALGIAGVAVLLFLKLIGFALANIPYFPLYVFVSMLAGLIILFFSLMSLQLRDFKREQVRLHSSVIELLDLIRKGK
jgi:dolichol-phosphate mannosyltransferase